MFGEAVVGTMPGYTPRRAADVSTYRQQPGPTPLLSRHHMFRTRARGRHSGFQSPQTVLKIAGPPSTVIHEWPLKFGQRRQHSMAVGRRPLSFASLPVIWAVTGDRSGAFRGGMADHGSGEDCGFSAIRTSTTSSTDRFTNSIMLPS